MLSLLWDDGLDDNRMIDGTCLELLGLAELLMDAVIAVGCLTR